MKPVYTTGRYQKDFKRAEKRGKDMQKLAAIVELIANGLPLPHRCRPHRLSGDYEDQWECHIEPDWLLIYDIRVNAVWLNRLGTHSDLFD